MRQKVMSSAMWQNYATLPQFMGSKSMEGRHQRLAMTWQIYTFHNMASKKAKLFASGAPQPNDRNYGGSREWYHAGLTVKLWKPCTAPILVMTKTPNTFYSTLYVTAW